MVTGVDAERRELVRSSLEGTVGGGFRPDIEGVRALAVVAVVLFHMEVVGFEGGFVGVDVFFVVSGFLITQLLLREMETTGTVSLHDFWARRARRLLPASCLVIVTTVVASRFLLAPSSLRDVGVDAIAAGAFVVNFVFAFRLGDYFNAQLGDVSPSPLLHFWSLAVEEQFYLLWPATLVGAARLSARFGSVRRTLVVLVCAVGAASLAASVWLTADRPTWAFYLLPARAVELLAGALLALAGTGIAQVDARYRGLLGWFGLAGIAYAVVAYDESVAFPGTAAMLPVLSTVLVLAAGGFSPWRGAPVAVLGLPPMLWIGRHSYAVYLWHWPVLVLAEARWGPLSGLQRVVAVAVAFGLSVASTAFVEDPVRTSRSLSRVPGRSVVMGAALSVVAVLVGLSSIVFRPSLDSGELADAPTLDLADSTEDAVAVDNDGRSAGADPDGLADGVGVDALEAPGGAGTETAPTEPIEYVTPTAEQLVETLMDANDVVLREGLAATDVPANLRPSVAAVYDDRPAVYPDGCVNIGVDDELHDCRYGTVGAERQVVLYGDSHAAQWMPAMEEIARDAGVELVVLAKGGCPTAAVSIATNTLGRTCPAWRDRVVAFLTELRPEMVVVTAWHDYDNPDAEWATGLDATLGRIAPTTEHLVVLADTPGASANPQECLSSNRSSMQSCSNVPERAVADGRVAVERQAAERFDAVFVDPSDWFCTDTGCPMTIGDILLYRDADHITTTGSTWFRPLLEAAIRPTLDRAWIDTQRIPAT